MTKIPEEDRKMILEQTKMYHKYHELVREGDYYRIASYRENHLYDCWAVADKDKREVLQLMCMYSAHPMPTAEESSCRDLIRALSSMHLR